MKHVIGLTFVLAAPLALRADSGDDVRKELKALEGKWKAVGMEARGKSFPKDAIPAFTFMVGADGKSTSQSFQGEYDATITVDPRKSPKTIDNLHVSGAQKGKKQYGIYKLEGDRWTVCMTQPGVEEGARPKDFTTKGSLNVVFVFERSKEKTTDSPSAAHVLPGEKFTPPAEGERHPEQVKAGEAAIDFSLSDPTGKTTISLSSFQGKKPVVLIFGSCT